MKWIADSVKIVFCRSEKLYPLNVEMKKYVENVQFNSLSNPSELVYSSGTVKRAHRLTWKTFEAKCSMVDVRKVKEVYSYTLKPMKSIH